ncbi:hypothetical protein BH09BAC5_BH09BAC5_16450 [soil metagenome]
MNSGNSLINCFELYLFGSSKKNNSRFFFCIFFKTVSDSYQEYSPALTTNYTYELAKIFNPFYDVCPVLKEENVAIRNFRLSLTVTVARTIKSAFAMLGIDVPERM